MSDADRTPDEIRTWLAEIVDMATLLPDAAITRTAGAKTSRPTPSSKPPTRLDVVHLLDHRDKPKPGVEHGMAWSRGMQYVDPDRIGVLPYLDGWCRDLETTLMDEHPAVPDETPEHPTVATCADWLTRHAEAAATTAQWPEVVYGLRVLRRNMRAATAGVRDERRRPVPCSRCGEPLERIGEQALWACVNGHETSVQAVTLNQAAQVTGAKKDQLYGFANRPGLLAAMDIEPLTPVLGDTGGRKLFDLNDIRRVLAEVKLRKGA